MSVASEFDTGPLSWVKTEVDLALNQAGEALTRYESGGDVTPLRLARNHLHQAHGALAMVGVDGVSQVGEALEALLRAMEEGGIAAEKFAVAASTAAEARQAIQRYLDDLMAGQPPQPLRLAPLHLAIAGVRGVTAHPADLFFPDLGRRPPRRELAEIPDPAGLLALVKSQRAQYQKALLTWLKKPELAEQARLQLQGAIAAIEAVQATPAARTFWWVALAFFDALAEATVASDNRARQLCSHIDGQIRRLLEGQGAVPDRLLRDALYFVAQVPASLSEAVAAVQASFDLSAQLPGSEAAPEPESAALRQLRESVGQAEGSWNKFCAGSGIALAMLAGQATQCARLSGELGQTDLKRLAQAFASLAHWLEEDASRRSPALAGQLGAALLLLRDAVEHFPEVGAEFAARVDAMVERLYAALAGRTGGDMSPLLEDFARRAEEKLFIGRATHDMQTQLALVEQALDAFFRESTAGLDGAALEKALKDVAAKLAMLGHLSAVTAVRECIGTVKALAAGEQRPDPAVCEPLAQQLSQIGLFVAALPEGASDFARFIERWQAPAVEPAEAERPAALVQHESAAVDLPATPHSEAAELAALEVPALDETPAVPTEMPSPSAETLMLAAAGGEAIDAELLAIFLEEARDVLATYAACLATLQAHPNEVDALTTIRRSTHTLKGSGRMVGLRELGEAAWALEQTLNIWLREERALTPELLALIEEARTVFSTWVEQLAAATGMAPDTAGMVARATALREAGPLDPHLTATAAALEELLSPVDQAPPAEAVLPDAPTPEQLPVDEIDPALLPVFLEEAETQLPALGDLLRQWRQMPGDAEVPRAIARQLHTFKGSARMAGAMLLGQTIHDLETQVAAHGVAGTVTSTQLDGLEAGIDSVAQAVESMRPALPVTPVTDELANAAVDVPVLTEILPENAGEPVVEVAPGQLRVRADLLDRLLNEAGEVAIARSRIESELAVARRSLTDLTDNVARLREQLREIEIQADTQIQSRIVHSATENANFDPLELDRYTRFQELTRFLAESVDDVSTVQHGLQRHFETVTGALAAQGRLTRSLQQGLMSVRMLPFASLADRLHRVVRQTAKVAGKQANLTLIGAGVEVDRSILDQMLPALEHMLRNAVTHGIEFAETRQATGKPEIGEITLSVAQEGNEIVLALADDGAGLDLDRIRDKAVAQGLIGPGAGLAPDKLRDLIFHPGFTTAAALTQDSGRGIGMDVVKTAVIAVGGRIEVSTERGQGSTFRLALPLTLVVMQAVLVEAGGQRFAIPSTLVEQVSEMQGAALAELQANAAIDWREQRCPAYTLARLLGLPEARTLPGSRWVLQLRSGNQRVAVLVEAMAANQEIVVKPVGPQVSRLPGIDGATVHGDGQVILILNPVVLAQGELPVPVTSTAAAAAAGQDVGSAQRPRMPTVLVVDDSLTVRKVTSRLLEREGYQVALAKDGTDALAQLAELRPEVILSDIEMPHMDGFELLRHLQEDDVLKSIPVIMITSRTAEKHRDHALALGARHYLGKPYDEAALLRQLSELRAGGGANP